MTAKFAPLLLVPAALALTLPPNALNVVGGENNFGQVTSSITDKDKLSADDIEDIMNAKGDMLASELAETMDRLDIKPKDILKSKLGELTPKEILQKLNPAEYAGTTSIDRPLDLIKQNLGRFPSLQKDEMIKRIQALGGDVSTLNTLSIRDVHKKYIEELRSIGYAGTKEDLGKKFESAIGRLGLDTQMIKDIKDGDIRDIKKRILESMSMVASLDQRDMPSQIKALQDTVTNLQLDEKTHFTSLVTAMNSFMKGKSFSWFTWPSWGN